jgi:hypothetical protein
VFWKVLDKAEKPKQVPHVLKIILKLKAIGNNTNVTINIWFINNGIVRIRGTTEYVQNLNLRQ